MKMSTSETSRTTRSDGINTSTRSDGSCVSSSSNSVSSSGSGGSRKSGDGFGGCSNNNLLSNINFFPTTSPKKQNHNHRHHHHCRSRKHHNLPLNLDCLDEGHGLIGRENEIHRLKDIWHQVQDISILECDDDKVEKEIGVENKLQELSKEVAPMTSLKPKKEIIVDKVWIRGESGCGKSTLIRQCLERIKNGYGEDSTGSGPFQLIVSGKFEQPTIASSSSGKSTSITSEDQRRPFSAISDVVTQLCDLIFENRQLKSTIQQLLQSGMTDAERRILGHSLPSIGMIVTIPEASQDALPPVTSEFAFQRFCDIFRKFWTAICSSPSYNISICMFLDDMQWCDEESLQVIKTLAKNDGSTNRLLLICATRDIDAPPVWDSTTTELSNTTQIIQLESLSESNVNQLVSKLLDCRAEKTEDLSQLVYSKTNGNPYFVIQYMELLHQRNLVRFHFSTGQWEYDLETIKSTTNVSDNVVDILTTRLQEMPSSVQETLRIAACLGFTFEVDVLDHVLSMMNVDLSVKGEIIEEGHCADEEEEMEVQVTTTEASDANQAIFTVAMSILKEEENVQDEDEEAPPATIIHPEGKQVITLKCARALKLAADYGLIEPSSFCCIYRSNLNVALSFKFSHDRVQQSALALLPAGNEGDELRIQLGMILLDLSRKSPSKDWMLFSAVDLLIDTGYGNDDTTTSHEVAMACRDAAVKARVRSAFEAAAKYADRGLTLLCGTDSLCWQQNEDTYRLCLELCTILSQSSYSHGDYEKSDMAARQIISNAKCLEDKLLAFSVRVSIFGSKGDLGSGVKEGIKVIALLGIDLPSKPTKWQIIMAVKKTERLMKGKKPVDLSTLPTMTDPRHVNQMRFLHTNCVLAWHAGQAHLCILQCLIMMQNTLSHGLCQFSPPAFCLYGALMARFQKYVEAFEFAKLALELLKQPNFREEAPLTLKIMHLFLYHLRKPLHESLEPLLEGYHLGMEIGDIQMASRTLCLHGIMCVVTGMPVACLTKQIEGYCQFFRDYRQHDCLLEISPWLQFTRALVSGSEASTLVLSGSVAEEEELNLIGQNDPLLQEDLTIRVYNVTARIMLYCVFGDYSKSYEECKDIKVFDDINYSFFLKPFLIFFSGLTYLCLAKESKKFFERRSLIRKGIYAMKELKKFLKGGSVNNVPMLLLLEAELYGALNESQDKVLKTYQSAIATAGRSGFRLIKAMACERAGQHCLNRCQDKFLADDYFVRAAKDYADYGALAKFIHIEKKYTIEDLSTSFLTQDTTTTTAATSRKSSSFFIVKPAATTTTTYSSELYISTSPF